MDTEPRPLVLDLRSATMIVETGRIPGATVANTALIRVFGRGGNDVITLNEANGALPPAALFGGAGLVQ